MFVEKLLQLVQLLVVVIRNMHVYFHVQVAFLRRSFQRHPFLLNYLHPSRLCDSILLQQHVSPVQMLYRFLEAQQRLARKILTYYKLMVSSVLI